MSTDCSTTAASSPGQVATSRLTQYTKNGGCGCKIAPAVLQQILKVSAVAPSNKHPNLLVGSSSSDDAAVVRIDDHTGVVSTTDFFMPIVDDPFSFGQVSACNAISDIYAMGAEPIMAIAILGWPLDKLSPETASLVIQGGQDICSKAGIALCGGHSIQSEEPIFGLAVTGRVNLQKIKRNSTASVKSRLFLSKPLGVGIYSAALKKRIIEEHEKYSFALENMIRLNDVGCRLGDDPRVTAMTDVTGFGLLGHLLEVCVGSNVDATIDCSRVPCLPDLRRFLEVGCKPGATTRNWDHVGPYVSAGGCVDDRAIEILCDPQTSGGLLVCFEGSQEELQSLTNTEIVEIGRCTESEGERVCIALRNLSSVGENVVTSKNREQHCGC